ncbi:MAG: hypothetical protein AAGJ95_09555, partial [Cyanobacteria bacterium J06554_11]
TPTSKPSKVLLFMPYYANTKVAHGIPPLSAVQPHPSVTGWAGNSPSMTMALPALNVDENCPLTASDIFRVSEFIQGQWGKGVVTLLTAR